MSFMMVDRLPVPKLSTYISATVLSISAATYYSVKYSLDASHESNSNIQVNEDPTKTDPMDVYYEQMLNVLAFMLQDPLCFLVLCNGAICSIVMIGAVIQSLVLGNLRPVEHVQFRERLWNWVIYKFIFMFIILKAYTLDKVALWLFWYSTLGFLHLMTSLCKDRFEYMWMSMGTGARVNWKYCPTCRLSLTLGHNQNMPMNSTNNGGQETLGTHTHIPHHFFHFDGSRYLSWLPSFSVEVTHSLRPTSQIHTSQMETMARQVLQLFPHFNMHSIIEDLSTTRSVDLTIDNILEGRLVAPQQFIEEEPVVVETTPIVNSVEQFINTSTPTSFNTNISEPAIDGLVSTGSQFSKSPDERENMLRARKQAMIMKARQRYMSKDGDSSSKTD
ncbi:PREDICTED: E3 ubiquitin-protein ligase AMFR-like [Diuraphis noxia]|uniref:E3 ubiquitin-protein ligase AMFR-like n=1 Tax=Diuraphis noxia TaxID=143948 RepID=UPI000763B59E|nr:PREDICTED: E3 ubiquitin-protein ligase AMFR-like [Diuraphis noxia]